ncbi:auxin-responsive protein SAUR61-like [Gossypium raimondii]|uniref:auxin-responsive protein SAUR61-like n=1 Tax=Gossypium raimondii TaxID=29730 RepID=UPI00227A4C3B|nr:auxin-responsive protein SAUR61-like [Gossypium raimondii]
MERKWKKLSVIGRRRITSSLVDNGHFVIYTIDQKRFVIPLAYLRNNIFMELLKMSEEEFGLPSDGPIIFPCDSVAMNYIVSLLRRSLSKVSTITTRKLIVVAGKWQKIATVGRKRITSARTNRKVASGAVNHYEKSSVVVKGCFVISTTDKRHFVIPLAFLSNCIFRELFKMSEEEFVLPSDGPITLPCDSVFMNYIISIVKRGLSKDLERAVVNSISTYCFSSDTYFNQGHEDTQSLVFGF